MVRRPLRLSALSGWMRISRAYYSERMVFVRPVLVVGTGRSGTSTTARLLQERFKIKMVRSDFLRADEWSPKGYFEDVRMKELSRKIMADKITPTEYARRARDWYTNGHEDVAWGFKLPQTCYHPPEVIDALDPIRIIACLRERTATARSIRTWRRGSFRLDETGGYRKYDERMAGLFKLLHGRQVLWLDFSEPRDEEDLAQLIEDYLPHPEPEVCAEIRAIREKLLEEG